MAKPPLRNPRQAARTDGDVTPPDDPGLAANMNLIRAAAGYANGKGISDDFLLSLEAGANLNFAEPETGLTALHYVAAYDKIDLLRFIARQSHCDFTVTDHAGRTPATLAYEVAGNSVTGRFLLTKEMRQRRSRQSSA